uniref:Uncharacterized protein n=1 Tax=Ditylenchus dipsaci TaxID=166011 RepID=A0A915DW27_9BILA
MQLLEANKKWSCDGTFNVSLFDQLWIVFVRLAHSYVAVVFCLLNRRLQFSYEFVLKQLLVLRPNLSPTSVAVDFKNLSLMLSSLPEGGNPSLIFHFQQLIIRNVSEKGSKSLHDSNEDFRREVNLGPAFAFVPSHDVVEAFMELRIS